MFRLALSLGRSIREVEQMDSAELSEWMAFDRVEPIGSLGADYRAGMVCATMANIHKSSKVTKTYSPQDFMPFFKKAEVKQSALSQFKLWVGHKVKR